VELGRRIGMHIINVTGEARKPIWKR